MNKFVFIYVNKSSVKTKPKTLYANFIILLHLKKSVNNRFYFSFYFTLKQNDSQWQISDS